MDHVVYLDAKSKELEKFVDGSKSMIIRGAAGRKLPYGRVNKGDILYFINNNGEGIIKGTAVVNYVFNSEKMEKDESIEIVEKNQEKLQLTDKQFKRWAGKRYIVLIEIENFNKIEEFKIDRSEYGNMDDWLPVEDINKVRCS
ncbi:hypothetical protein [Oceanirhabdus sp. W0125-5]|uniref:hypothetical protein n=1 Tax=Oceanirhabdus sp. W0125-5 TaxID=2999116 RepID=UPI0022F307C8|nr:hypothetical protein [Oceanirhabdus sp. W0125-5]WBW95581.1 hypothetical protein OW730_18050 [Oceanirhabdus sp. W0125-5]